MEWLLHTEYVQTLLSTEAKVDLTEKLIIVAIVWATMARKVSNRMSGLESKVQAGLAEGREMFQTHLSAIEKKFDQAIVEMKGMKETFSNDLKVNTERLGRVEDDVRDIKKQLNQTPH